jgi:hypothetical protein
MTAAAIFFFALSCPGTGEWLLRVPGLERLLSPAQFAYRLVTYGNLALLLALLLGGRRLPRPGLALCVLISFVGLGLKLGEVRQSMGHDPASTDSALRAATDSPPAFLGFGDYMRRGGGEPLSPPLAGKVETVFLPASVRRATPGWAIVNLYPFSWNRLTLDGGEAPRTALAYARRRPDGVAGLGGMPSKVLMAYLPAGEHHLDWEFDAPPAFRLARQLSLQLMLAWVLAQAVSWVALALGWRRGSLMVKRVPRPT